MKRITISIILCVMIDMVGAENLSYHIKTKEYEGYVFCAGYNTSLFCKSNRFTPNKDEIANIELLIKVQIKYLNSNAINQVKNCPIIHKKIRKYKRQYIGYIDEEGNKIIWVNCIWHKKVSDYWSKELQIVLDGCSYFWGVKVNLYSNRNELQITGDFCNNCSTLISGKEKEAVQKVFYRHENRLFENSFGQVFEQIPPEQTF